MVRHCTLLAAAVVGSFLRELARRRPSAGQELAEESSPFLDSSLILSPLLPPPAAVAAVWARYVKSPAPRSPPAKKAKRAGSGKSHVNPFCCTAPEIKE